MKNHPVETHRYRAKKKKQNFLSRISSVNDKKRREKKLLRVSRIEELDVFIIRAKFNDAIF